MYINFLPSQEEPMSAIQCEFEAVGLSLLKNPLDAG